MRYEAVYSPNYNQWFAYDSEMDIFIDPPVLVLNEIAEHGDSAKEQEAYFNQLLAEEPDWLLDTEYSYDDI